VKSYTYTMVYDFEKSVAKYIEPKFKFEEWVVPISTGMMLYNWLHVILGTAGI
jgi:hypothetical protein